MDAKTCQTAGHCCARPPTPTIGILNINKPAGLTSFDVVARVRKITGCRRVGHAGTLDPDATGVLLVCLGPAARLIQFLGDATKTYAATVTLGSATDTYDASGKVTFSADPSGITREQVEEVLRRFVGTIRQTAPAFSALKVNGRPLYELARKGVEVTPPERMVRIEAITMDSWDPPSFSMTVQCGKGTYIRSLAHDAGKVLGCGAHLASLCRTRSGSFNIADAVTLAGLEAAASDGTLEQYVHPADSAVSSFPAFILSPEQADAAICGRVLALQMPAGPADWHARARAYDAEGEFIGLIEPDTTAGLWRPSLILARRNHRPCECSSSTMTPR